MASLVMLLGCGGGGAKSLELTLTNPDATKASYTLSGETGFLFAGEIDAFPTAPPATLSWPDIGTWNTKVPIGVSVDVPPLQPGTHQTGGSLHLGSGTVAAAKGLTLTVNIARVAWTGSAAFPFRLEGTLEGTSTAGHTVSGRFISSFDDCTDAVKSNGNSYLCGLAFPSKDYRLQTWSIERWGAPSGEECPAAITARFGGGTQLTINASTANAGGAKPLQCVVTSEGKYRVVCGANEESFMADGCPWSITAIAMPGAIPNNTPHVGIFAGTTGSTCAPKRCVSVAGGFTHVSGATF